ncbi:hypothetical protein [Streptomyces pratensis]|uniref:hypothetical protein n=1 Tax=Streptomyces pratensis TaxID=1169025 RepID=UPI001EE3F097|nr:hypothetical protein [Streptomyces pratensis]
MSSGVPAETRRLLLVARAGTALTAGALGWFAAQSVRAAPERCSQRGPMRNSGK